MSTPIYDSLCDAMPGPSGSDEEEAAVPAQGAEVDGAAEQDGHGDGATTANAGATTANGRVSTTHEGDGAAARNGRVESNTAPNGTEG